MTSGQRADEAPERRRAQVLAALRAAAGPVSIVELAGRLDLHPSTVRFHLEALTETGQAERVTVPRSGPGRPALMFRAHQGMDPAGPRHYQLLAEVLVADLSTHPHPGRRAIQAGEAWGSRLGQARASRPDPGDGLDQLVGLLDELDFAPEARATPNEVGLRHCPFLEVAVDRRTVVCPLHLGLLRGAMAELDPSLTVEGLDPFVEPDLCLVRLARDEGSAALDAPEWARGDE